jgi:fluoride ion exporter CrcB/FEX
MIDVFLDGVIVVLMVGFYGGVTLWCFEAWMDNLKSKFWATFICIVMNSFVLGSIIAYEEENPCAKYETQMHYNAATKTAMPMKVCIERGEWVQ